MTTKLEIGLFDRISQFFLNPAKYKILQKGRQVGGTCGGIYTIIQQCLTKQDLYILWIDTAYRQINIYWEKYWNPVLSKLPKAAWSYNKNESRLKLNGNTVLFKSYDNAESIEGDNYTDIYINECGFLLRDGTLWKETLYPMLLRSDGNATFFGTPKSGKNSYHYELVNSIKQGKLKGWYLDQLSTFDNPYVPKHTIERYLESVDPQTAKTEIYGEFRDNSIKNFFYAFDFDKHIAELLPPSRIWISFDFNITPMTCIIGEPFQRGFAIYDEIWLENADITMMCDEIKKRYSTNQIIAITGDASGMNGSGLKANVNYYIEIQNQLNLRNGQVYIGSKNPTHINSRIHCNSILSRGDITIDPRCKHLIDDLSRMEFTDKEQIDKSNPMLTHVGDCLRYFIDNFNADFIYEFPE